MPSEITNLGQNPFIKSRPAVYQFADKEIVSRLEPEVRMLLSEGLVSLAELGTILNRMPPFVLFLMFQSLMYKNSWSKAVICKLRSEGSSIIVSDEFAQADFNGDMYVPKCWSDAVIDLVSQDVRGVRFEGGRHVATFFKKSERCWIQLLSNPCKFKLTNVMHFAEVATP